jgi:hypothetical protein
MMDPEPRRMEDGESRTIIREEEVVLTDDGSLVLYLTEELDAESGVKEIHLGVYDYSGDEGYITDEVLSTRYVQ